MKLSNTRSHRLLRISVILASVFLFACVTQGSHERVVQDLEELRGEAKRLRAHEAELELERERLEAENRSLTRERVGLSEEVEDLRLSTAALNQRVQHLERARTQLESDLRQRETEIAQLRDTYDGLLADLESEVEAGRIQVEQLRSGLRLNLPSDVLFASGSADLNKGGSKVLTNVASRLKKVSHQVRVEGHTDGQPLRGHARFASNWELAGARAASVVRWLVDAGVGAERLSAVSYGEFHPIAPNDTPEGRSSNRRIEILLIPAERDSGPASPPVASGQSSGSR
jgi:chemotaxis protein MotB